jgi:putative heme-binding domain-containing protein
VTPADIEAGARLYAAQCAGCHGMAGNQVANVDLATGRFRAGSSDEALARTIGEGIPGTAMRAHRFTPNEMSTLIAYIRSLARDGSTAVTAAALGDASAGQRIVEDRGRCLTCHRINGTGARRATDLSDVGVTRTPDAIDAALRQPISKVAPGGRFVRAVTAEGSVITGRRLNEDTFTVQLLDDRDRLVSLIKADLREYSVSTVIGEAAHVVPLTDAERRDVVAYLASLVGLDAAAPRGGRP